MATDKTPEFESMRVCMYDICSSLSSKSDTLTILAADLYSLRLIAKGTYDEVKAGAGRTHPFELATTLVSAVHTAVQYNPSAVYEFAAKLAKSGNKEASCQLLQECESRGGRKAPPTSVLHIEIDERISQQAPTLKLFHKHVGQELQNEWKEIGALLGIPLTQLNTIEASHKRNEHAMIDVYEWWEKRDEVEFTWGSLLKILDSSPIDKDRILTIKQGLIKDLSNDK